MDMFKTRSSTGLSERKAMVKNSKTGIGREGGGRGSLNDRLNAARNVDTYPVCSDRQTGNLKEEKMSCVARKLSHHLPVT